MEVKVMDNYECPTREVPLEEGYALLSDVSYYECPVEGCDHKTEAPEPNLSRL
jgi:hypothetical protein